MTPRERMAEVSQLIRDGQLGQELIGHLADFPVLHFSDHAAAIMLEGFTKGESIAARLDNTLEGGVTRDHPGPGYGFAFNAVHWNVENDCFDYEVATELSERNLMGMYAETAVLFPVSGLHTRHTHDQFNQVIFWGPAADMTGAILLTNTGTFEVDGEEACDENGNPFECWEASLADGTVVVAKEDMRSLRECVIHSLLHMQEAKSLSVKAAQEMLTLYEPELEAMEVKINDYFNDLAPEVDYSR
ncbi:hypothetical protein [Pseudomonas nitroreducens]|nr:hypothetical protein [Pseudomonas nitritireducens]